MSPDDALVVIPEGVELVPLDGTAVDVVAVPRPFSTQRLYVRVREGRTISEILAQLGIPVWAEARVFIDDWLVPRSQWARVKPRAGRRVTIRVVPSGSQGGGDSNKTWRILLQVVVTIVAIVLIWLSYGAATPGAISALAIVYAAAAVAVQVGGTIAINALFPPPSPKLAALTGTGSQSESPTLAITGARNQANLYGPVPRIFGTHRVFPPYGAQPFTELSGNTQFLRLLFAIGYGPLDLTDLRIGDTPLSQFQEVEVETRSGLPDDAPMTLFPQRVHEESLSVLLSFAGGWQSRTSPLSVDELSIDVVFPQGLGAISGKGTKFGWDVQIEIQYAPIGTEDWHAVTTIDPAAATTSAVYGGFRWSVVRGQYVVRLRRVTPDTEGLTDLMSLFVSLGRMDLVNALEDTGSVVIGDLCFWSALRSFTNTDPIAMPGVAKVALRIKASEQLHGMIDSFNCLATAILPDWDAGTQTWISQATASPAAAYRQVLQGRENHRAVADARVDLPSLQHWAEACTAWGFTFNHVVDYSTTVFELLRTIAGSARAAFTMFEDRYGVVFEKPQTVPVQFFTPRNSREFKGLKNFPDPVHALKMHFINPATNWQQDERIVYDDGYNADGSEGLVAATRFETVDLTGTTDPDQAYKHGRYHLAAARLRPEIYELVTDIENLVCTRGDLVHVAHDVPMWGLGWGRVLEATSADGGATMATLRVDEPFPMETGKAYTVRIRGADGTNRVVPVTTVAGLSTTLALSPPVPAPLAEPGDLVLFGETGRETAPLLVRLISPMADFMARIQLVDAAPAILDADTGPIPPWDSLITQPPPNARYPAIPQIESIRSDESVLIVGGDGTTRNRILITLRAALSGTPFVDFFELRYRTSGLTAWQVLPNVSGDATELFISDVEEGVAYDLRLRAAHESLRSDWRTVLNYVVVGKSAPPPDVAGLTLLGSALTWSYPRPPIDLAGFVIRRASGSVTRWDDGLALHGGLVTATTSFTLPPMSGIWTLMVKAEDTVGNLSVTPASLTVDFGDPLLHNIVETRDEHAQGFPGTKEQATVSGITGDLEADQVPAGFWSGATAPFWMNPAGLFWTSPYEELRYTWTYLTGAQAVATTLLIEPGTQGVTAVEYKESASPTWLDFPGAVTGIKANTSYDFRVTIAAGVVQGIIQTLVIYLDAPDLTEHFDDLAIAGGGTRLTLTNTYRTIKSVTATVQAFGAETAITARVQDKNATLGPLIETLDPTGASVPGHVDLSLVGF